MLTEHVSETDLLLAFDGELASQRAAAVRAHTANCRSCETQWTQLSALSRDVAAFGPAVSLQPEAAAVASLRARLAKVEKRSSWTTRSLVFANSLAAIAAACVCILLLPSLRHANRVADLAVPHAAAVYDIDQAVPQGYMSLPFADPALPIDESAVLPVELTAEDLELMGVPASDVPPGSGVQAEILLGMDGWPRAIKIVEQY